MSVRYVRPLTEQQRTLLESTMKNDASHRARMRAHSLLLSSEGRTIKAIAKIYHVDRDTVATWIKKWGKHGDKSLHDQPRSGRPTILNTTEKELAKQYIKEEPRSLKNVAERLAQKTAKRLSMSSLKRLAKKARLRWKRVRKSLKSLRDPLAFAQCKRELEVLQKQEDHGGRSFQSGEGWHSTTNAVRFWKSSPRMPKETHSRCYASATAYVMMIPPCNNCSAQSKRPTRSRS